MFDLEDTLVNTPWSDREHVFEFRQDTKKKLLSLGVPAEVLEGVERSTIMRNRASGFVEDNFDDEGVRRFRREMQRFLKEYELNSARKSSLFSDCVSTLETLSESGVKLGVVTNTSRQAVEIVFRIHGLGRFFDAIVTRESVKRLKPDPEGVLMAAKKLGAKNFFVVGDLALDVLAAKAAGGVAILVRRTEGQSVLEDTAKSLPEELLREAQRNAWPNVKFQPDYVVSSLAEVPRIVGTKRPSFSDCRFESRHASMPSRRVS